MSKTFYKTYELVQRLDSIPTVKIKTFEEPYLEDGTFISTITIHFPEEFDTIAYERVTAVVDEASHWVLDEPPNPEEDSTTIRFTLSSNAPTALQEKFELV